jgi:3-oxoacyl-[acyl-carrier protein] reductase
VTGGGRGIGRAVDGQLAAAGAKVAVADIAMESAQKAARGIIAEGASVTALAREVARSNIMVNAVTPALVDTAMVREIAPDQVKYLTELLSIGRLGTAEEVGTMVCWLASKAVSFSTGDAFDISGGRATC